MLNLVLIGIGLFVVVVLILIFLSFALRIALVVGIVALVVFGGIYLAFGKEGLDTSLDTTGHVIEEVRESDAYQDIKDTAKEYGEKAVDKTKEKIFEIIE